MKKAVPETVSTGRMASKPLPDPALPEIDRTFNIIVTGIGGTGVVTIGAIIGMAAHLEGKGLGMIDMAGLAQKGGAVYSHVRLAKRQRTSTRSASRRARPTSCWAAISSSPAPRRCWPR